ncbi:unnamed protein product, partial [Urochloa humidicola]
IEVTISVVSVPKLHVLSLLCKDLKHDVGNTTFQFGSTSFQRLCFLNLTTVVHSVKVLALTQMDLSLDKIINFLKCFPCTENLYIKTRNVGEKNTWCHKYKNLFGTLEIRLKKIVLRYYRGNTSHVNFAKFFVLNARMLQSMRLELFGQNPSSAWIERQHGLLQLKKKASGNAQFDFASSNSCHLPPPLVCAEQVHDLSRADPFHNWV